MTTSELSIQADQQTFNTKQLAALEQLGVAGASRADQAIFFHHCVRTGLDPFARQIYMIGRKSQVDGKWTVKQTIQTGIDGFRLIARRAADRRKETLGYVDDLWCGEDGLWRDVWLSNEPPAAAKVTVLRNGQSFPAVALFSELKQTKANGELTKMWRDKPVHMIGKCAEALALRKAFPQDLSGLYTDDETGFDLVEDAHPEQVAARRMSRSSHLTPVEADVVEEAEPANPDEQAIRELNDEATEQATEHETQGRLA